MAKTAIVTGSSRGIGRAIAEKLGSQGFNVVVNYVGNKAEADKVAAAVEAAGGKTITVQADVARVSDAEKLFSEAERAFGGVDVLVNNAGILEMKPIGEVDDDFYNWHFDINVRGTFNLLRLAATKLCKGGRVVNFSSTAIALALPGYAIYNASKAAVEEMTRVFAKELRGKEITVNAVAPGPTSTELFFKGKTEEQVERLTKMSPLERLGRPEEIAELTAFLVSDAGSWVNGQVVRANGGIA